MAVRITATALIAGLIGLWAVAPCAAQPTAPTPAPLGDPPPPLTDAAFDAAYQCPEALAGDAQRQKAMVEYYHWVYAAHPDWSTADAVEYRKTLLTRHQCAASLRDLATYTKRER